ASVGRPVAGRHGEGLREGGGVGRTASAAWRRRGSAVLEANQAAGRRANLASKGKSNSGAIGVAQTSREPVGRERSLQNNLPPRSRWPTADKKRSCPPGALLALASSCGQRRTEAVIGGHNPVALAACSPRPPK